MKKIDEIYCRALRAAGSHGTWQPGSRAWPGDYGEYQSGIFKRLGSLKSRGYSYDVEPDQTAAQVITSERVSQQLVSAGGQASDLLEIFAAASGKVSFEFSDENEVALITMPGMWQAIVDVEDLLAQVQRRIESWPTSRLIVCSVFETDEGIAAVSTGASRAVEIDIGAKGAVHGAVKVVGDVDFSPRWSNAIGWTQPFSSPVDLPAEPSEPRSSKSTPLFGHCYRVRRTYWNMFGARRMEDIDGNVIEIDPALLKRHDEMDEAERVAAIADLKQLDVYRLFELLEPQRVNDELDEERGVERRVLA